MKKFRNSVLLVIFALSAGLQPANAQTGVRGVEFEVTKQLKYQEFIPGIPGLYEIFGKRKVCEGLASDCDQTSFHGLVWDAHSTKLDSMELAKFNERILNKKTTEKAVIVGQILDQVAIDRLLMFVHDYLLRETYKITREKVEGQRSVATNAESGEERREARKKLKSLEKQLRLAEAKVDKFIKLRVKKHLRIRQDQECIYVYGMEILDRNNPSSKPGKRVIPNTSEDYRNLSRSNGRRQAKTSSQSSSQNPSQGTQGGSSRRQGGGG